MCGCVVGSPLDLSNEEGRRATSLASAQVTRLGSVCGPVFCVAGMPFRRRPTYSLTLGAAGFAFRLPSHLAAFQSLWAELVDGQPVVALGAAAAGEGELHH